MTRRRIRVWIEEDVEVIEGRIQLEGFAEQHPVSKNIAASRAAESLSVHMKVVTVQ